MKLTFRRSILELLMSAREADHVLLSDFNNSNLHGKFNNFCINLFICLLYISRITNFAYSEGSESYISHLLTYLPKTSKAPREGLHPRAGRSKNGAESP